MKTDGGYLVHLACSVAQAQKKGPAGTTTGGISHGALIRMAVIVFRHHTPVSAKYGAGLSEYETQSISVHPKVLCLPAVLNHSLSLHNTQQLYGPPYVQDYWQMRPMHQCAQVLWWHLGEASACGMQIAFPSKWQQVNSSCISMERWLLFGVDGRHVQPRWLMAPRLADAHSGDCSMWLSS